MTFLRVPFRCMPPIPCTPGLIQAALQPPQQGQGHHLHLEGALHGFLGPGSACFHAEALWVVAAAVFRANACGTRLHNLSCRTLQGRGDQAPGLAVPRPLDAEPMHGELWSTERPPAPQVFVPKPAEPARHPGLTCGPGGGPVDVVLWGRKPLAPRRPTTFPPGSGRARLGQPRVHPQPGQNLNPSLSRSGVHTGLDDGCDRLSPIEHAQNRRARLCVRLAQERRRPGGRGVIGLPGGQLVLTTIQARAMRQIRPRRAWHKVAHHDLMVALDCLGPIRMAGTGVMNGAGSPNLGAGPVPLGIVDRHRMIGPPRAGFQGWVF
jgi:hypothetical protein